MNIDKQTGIIGDLPSLKEMSINPITLSFNNNQLESEFANDYYRKSLIQVRISFVLAILLYALFGIFDMESKFTFIFWLIRFSVIIPIGILVLISSYSHQFKKFKDITFALSMILFGIGINLMIIMSDKDIYFAYYAALIITFIFVHIFISIRFVPATLTGLIILLLYEFTAIFVLHTPSKTLIYNNYFFISANIIGMFSSYSIELFARRDFFIAKILEENKNELDEINRTLEVKVKKATNDLRKINQELNTKLTIIKQNEQKIKDSLFEKEVLLKEIHHRVKNNMQIISSLLYLQGEYTDDEKIKNLLIQSQNRIYSMALIHEKLYQSKNLAKIDFKDYVESLTANLLSIYGKTESVKINISVGEMCLNINSAIPLGLIVNELIINAFKHGYPNGKRGTIDIKIVLDDDELILSVFNDGEKFPSEKDLDDGRNNSYGLNLIKILTEQLDGELSLDRTNGTEFLLKLKINSEEK